MTSSWNFVPIDSYAKYRYQILLLRFAPILYFFVVKFEEDGSVILSKQQFQLSTRKEDFLIDTLSLRFDLHQLNEILTNPAILKVMRNDNAHYSCY